MNFHNLSEEIWEKTKGIDGWCTRDKTDTLLATVLAFKPKRIVESGVYAGRSLSVFGLSVKAAGLDSTIEGIDSWCKQDMMNGFDQQTEKDHWEKCADAGVLIRKKHEAYGWIESFGIKDITTIHEMSIDAAIPMYADCSIDLLHIDAGKAYEDSMRHDVLWLPKVKLGGIIVVDDTDWPTARSAYMLLRTQCRELYEVRFHGEQAFSILQREK